MTFHWPEAQVLRLRFLRDTIKYQDLGHKSPDFFNFFFGGVPDENPESGALDLRRLTRN